MLCKRSQLRRFFGALVAGSACLLVLLLLKLKARPSTRNHSRAWQRIFLVES